MLYLNLSSEWRYGNWTLQVQSGHPESISGTVAWQLTMCRPSVSKSRFSAAVVLYTVSRVIQFAEQLIERGARSILDLGCGSGRHVVSMSKKGLLVSGLDNAPTALKLTREWLQQEQLEASLILADMRQPLLSGCDAKLVRHDRAAITMRSASGSNLYANAHNV